MVIETKDQNDNNLIKKVVITVLLVTTLISFYCRIFFGWDQDQSYLTLLATKLASGSILFKDLWDLHQTSMIWAALFSKVFWAVRGSWDGVGVYLRIISIVFQAAIAFWSYLELKKYFGVFSSFLAAIVIANILPRASQQLEYGSLSVWLSLIVALLVIDINNSQNEELFKLIVAAILYAISIFSYPTMIVSVPVLAWAFLWDFGNDYSNKNRKIKNLVLFFTMCGAVALIIVCYLMQYMVFSELFGALKAISNSGDHESLFGSFLLVDYWEKSFWRVVATIAMALGGWLLSKYIFKKEIKPYFFYIGFMAFIVLFLNITGLRPSGPFGFLERYIGAVILGIVAGFQIGEKRILKMFYLLGITYYIGSLIGSNMGPNENAMYLELAVLGTVLAASETLKWNSKDELFEKSAVLLFVFSIIFAAGYFIRVNYTSPANVFECTEKFQDGPAKGVAVNPDQMEEFLRKKYAIEHISEEGKIYALITNESIYNFYLKGSTSAAGYAPTSNRNYNELWINYYDEFGHTKPDVILVNTYWYPYLQDFYKEIFGKWVEQNYRYEPTEYESEFWKLVYKGE